MSAKYFTLKFGSCLIFESSCILCITCCFTLFCSSSALWAKNSYEFFGLNYFSSAAPFSEGLDYYSNPSGSPGPGLFAVFTTADGHYQIDTPKVPGGRLLMTRITDTRITADFELAMLTLNPPIQQIRITGRLDAAGETQRP